MPAKLHILALVVAAVSTTAAAGQGNAGMSLPDDFSEIVTRLAAADLAGRRAGTPGGRLAGEYIAAQFASAGLTGGGEGGEFFQTFTPPDLRLAGAGCRLTLPGGPAAVPGQDFVPVAGGAQGEFAGPLAFAGFGYGGPLGCYNDFAGLDARGAVAMLLDDRPTWWGRWSACWGKPYQVKARVLKAKLAAAAAAGASAVLLVMPTGPAEREDLYDVVGKADGPLPVLRISKALADRLLGQVSAYSNSGCHPQVLLGVSSCRPGATADVKLTVDSLANRILTTRKPASFTTELQLSGRVELVPGTARNVLGILPATETESETLSGRMGETPMPLTGGTPVLRRHPVVVIGAHYDAQPANSLRARDPRLGPCPGADDNASGVAALILTARLLAAQPNRRCTYVFAAFDHEEPGFFGSRFYADHPLYPLDRTAVMVNFDQLGRLRGGNLLVLGKTWSKPYAPAMLAARADAPPLPTAGRESPALHVWRIPFTSTTRLSDQSSFARRGVDTLFFHTGLHGDYHKTTDTADKVNTAGGASVVEYVVDVLAHLDGKL